MKYLRLKLLTMNHVFVEKGRIELLQKKRWSCNGRKLAFRFESINFCVSKTVRCRPLTAIKVSCNSQRTSIEKSVTELRKFLMQTIMIRTNCMLPAFHLMNYSTVITFVQPTSWKPVKKFCQVQAVFTPKKTHSLCEECVFCVHSTDL